MMKNESRDDGVIENEFAPIKDSVSARIVRKSMIVFPTPLCCCGSKSLCCKCLKDEKRIRTCSITMVCLLVVFIVWTLSFFLSSLLFFIYDHKERENNELNIERIQRIAGSSFQKEISNTELLSRSLRSFISESSSTDSITKGAFERYVTDSGLVDLKSFLSASWIVEVPLSGEEYFRNEFIHSVGLLNSEINILNCSVGVTPLDDHHHCIVVLTTDDDWFGKDVGFSSVEGEIHDILIDEAIKTKSPKFHADPDVDQIIEMIYPIVVINESMNNTMNISNILNSVIFVRFNVDVISSEAFEIYQGQALFSVFSDGECLLSSCQDPGSASGQTRTFNPFDDDDDDDDNDIYSDLNMDLSITPLDDFYDTELRVSKIFGIVGPLFGSVVITLLLLPVCIQCISYMKKTFELKTIKQVSKALSEMDFSSKRIIKLNEMKRPSKVEKYMRRIVENMILYRSYLPRTLLYQFEEKNRMLNTPERFLEFQQERESSMDVKSDSGSEKNSLSNDEKSPYRQNDNEDDDNYLEVRSPDSNRNPSSLSTQPLSSPSNHSSSLNEFFTKKCKVSSISNFSKYSNCSKRDVVIMIVRFDNFNILEELPNFQNQYQQWVSKVIDVTRIYNGEFLYHQCECVYFSWNAVGIKFDGGRRSLTAAFQLKKLMYFKKQKISLTIVMTKGPAVVGHFEISKYGIRQFDVLGYPLFTGIRIMTRSIACSNVVNIFCDEGFRNDVRFLSEALVVDAIIEERILSIPSLSSKDEEIIIIEDDEQQTAERSDSVEKIVQGNSIKIFEILSFVGNKKRDEEWMYQCKTGFDRNDSNESMWSEIVEEAWDDYISGKFDDAKKCMNKIIEGKQGNLIQKLRNKIQFDEFINECIRKKKQKEDEEEKETTSSIRNLNVEEGSIEMKKY